MDVAQGHRVQRPDLDGAGHVERDIDMALVLEDARDPALDGGGIGHVADVGDERGVRLRRRRVDVGRGARELFRGPGAAMHPEPARCQLGGDQEAEATRGTGERRIVVPEEAIVQVGGRSGAFVVVWYEPAPALKLYSPAALS